MPNQHGLPEPDVPSITRVQACIRLGRKMAAALERYAAADSLERNLAAEISVMADGLTGVSDGDLEQRGAPLVEAVTALWSYRFDFPEAARPFPFFEPALRAVQYLDREASYPVDTASEWISLAKAAGFNDGFELTAIDRFGSMPGPDFSGFEDSTPYEVARATDKLQAMIELASFLKPVPIP